MICNWKFFQVFQSTVSKRLNKTTGLLKSLSILSSELEKFVEGKVEILVVEKYYSLIIEIRPLNLFRHARNSSGRSLVSQNVHLLMLTLRDWVFNA